MHLGKTLQVAEFEDPTATPPAEKAAPAETPSTAEPVEAPTAEPVAV